MHSRILVPIDLANVDKLSKALGIAARIAKEEEAEVIYLGVVDAVPTASPVSEGEQIAEDLRRFSEAKAERHGIKTDHHVALRSDLRLNIATDVIKTAEAMGCDLIVMASHMPGLKDHFLPSNAGAVATHAPVSVYVVR